MKYIDAEKLKAEIDRRIVVFYSLSSDTVNPIRIDEDRQLLSFIDSIQQDETQVDRMLCSQIWWEEQGWIMIPPDATVEGIDSLLRQVKKKLQQEQPEVDLKKEIDNYFLPIQPWQVQEEPFTSLEKCARHFYELGLNARKEENK